MNRPTNSFNFSFNRAFAVTKRVLKQFLRDRRTFAMILIMPSIIMLVFGLALSGEINNIPIVIENADKGFPSSSPQLTFGADITNYLVEDSRVKVYFGNYSDSIEKVENGEYFAAILIPENFTELFFRKNFLHENVTITLTIYIDASKPQIRASILGALRDAMEKTFGGSILELNQIFAFGGAEYSGLEVSTPSVMSLVLTFLVILISTITIVREKMSYVHVRLYTTPLTARERLLGYSIGLTAIALILSSTVLLVGIIFFNAPIRGSPVLLILSTVLYALTNVFIAVLLSNFAENELQAVQFAPIISFPSMALSGMLVPINSFPSYVKPLSYIIPMTYAINIFEGIMLKGWGFKQLWKDFAIITGMTVLFLILAILTIKDRMED